MERMPKIKVSGVINSDQCMIANDFTGQFELEVIAKQDTLCF